MPFGNTISVQPRRTPEPQAQPVASSHPRAYVDMVEAAENWTCRWKTIRRMIARGDVATYKYGSRVVKFELSDLDAIYGE